MVFTSFPTGLYNTILPTDVANRGNVIYALDSQPPKATILNFSEVIQTILLQPTTQPVNSFNNRRASYGKLVTATQINNNFGGGSGNNIYYSGQILEFSPASDILASVNALPTSNTKITYNLQPANTASIGISNDQLTLTLAAATAAHNSLLMSIAEYQTLLNTYNAQLVTYQQQLAESVKVTSALSAVIAVSSNPAITAMITSQNAVQSNATTKIVDITSLIATTTANMTVAQNRLQQLTPIIQ